MTHALPSTLTVAPSRAAPRSFGRALAAPMSAGLALRVAILAAIPVHPTWDGVIYARAAESLAHGEGFTRTIFGPGQPAIPTAFYPVGFPAVLAPLRALGLGAAGDLALQCALGTLLVPIAWALGRRAAGPRAGTIAAWAIALWPGGILLSASWLTEPLFACLLGAAACIVAWSRRRRRARSLVLAALVLGLAAYVRATALPILAMLALGVALVGARPSAVHALRNVVLALAVAGAVLAPWAVRNATWLGAPVPVSTNGGLNLLIGTFGDGSFGEIPAAEDCARGLREIEKDRCRTARAIARIRARPVDALGRALLKLTHTFGHESTPAEAWATSLVTDEATRQSARLVALGISRLYWIGLFAAACAGLPFVLRRRTVVRVVLLAPIVATAALHAATIGGDRYHAPLAPLFAVLAAIAYVRRGRASPIRRYGA